MVLIRGRSFSKGENTDADTTLGSRMTQKKRPERKSSLEGVDDLIPGMVTNPGELLPCQYQGSDKKRKRGARSFSGKTEERRFQEIGGGKVKRTKPGLFRGGI